MRLNSIFMDDRVNMKENFFDLEGKFYEAIYLSGKANPEFNRRVLSFYIPFFQKCRRVLDVGCGRGEFLELLRENGVSGIGIDIDARMIQVCREKSLEVVRADLFDYLENNELKFDGIFCSNVIEHMNEKQVLRFFQLAYRSVEPGGTFLVATPNPESMIVHLYEFWRDPTHIRMYSLDLLIFMLEYAGFQDVNGSENPETRWPDQKDSEFREQKSLKEFPKNNIKDFKFKVKEINIFDIPDIRQTLPWPRRWLYRFRRWLARLIINSVIFEELFVLNELNNRLIQELNELNNRLIQELNELNNRLNLVGLYRAREIYAFGVKKDD